jgi:hypothetical protein
MRLDLETTTRQDSPPPRLQLIDSGFFMPGYWVNSSIDYLSAAGFEND